MQLDELIPNITLAFLQRVTRAPKIGFPATDLGFLGVL